ncbi:HNH endonuclease [Leptolyngbya sp. FACHB-17]|nr:HNH endonuclease [Leptolyngbya sp. FACHB-17]
MLLIETIGGEHGKIPVLGIVKVFVKEQMQELSKVLWGETGFPYIYFFDTETISLSWTEFKDQVSYKSNYRVPGFVSRVKPEKLQIKFNGVQDYVGFLRMQAAHQSSLSSEEIFPDEAISAQTYYEGATRQVSVNVYERNPKARRNCIAHHGLNCSVCGFNFKQFYGELGEGYIHVHHLKPLSEIGEEYELDPIEDLRPVCPNCHAMLHRSKSVSTIGSLQQLIKRSSS